MKRGKTLATMGHTNSHTKKGGGFRVVISYKAALLTIKGRRRERERDGAHSVSSEVASICIHGPCDNDRIKKSLLPLHLFKLAAESWRLVAA